ncbi:TIM44-like domain-containing protein [Alphaproteobacteria bacterium]|nr:TIM44-like domain-containing protein [Alphaproteobacteria bacterium]
MSSEFLDIILFGVVAIFLIMRLKNTLGTKNGKIINIKNLKQNTLKPKTTTKTTKSDISDDFLEGANQAFTMIVEAYQSNNTTKVKDLLSSDALNILNDNKPQAHIKFMNIKSSKIISSNELDSKLVHVVGFESEHYDVKINKIITVSEEWGFEKEKKTSDPNWKLFSIKVVS